ncbi:MAG TPA: hypothetical protein ENJ13_01040 [Chromatiales bacterium]|nr:hypothetical protein [Chromatiales bacterium]
MNVAIYCIGAAAIIALLINLSSSGALSSGMGLGLAFLLVVILPCFLAARIVKKERAEREE